MIADVVALAGTILAAAFLVPQSLRLRARQDSSGVSIAWAAFGVITNAAWVLYLLAVGVRAAIVAPLLAALAYATTLGLVARLNRRRAWVWASSTWALSLTATGVVGGARPDRADPGRHAGSPARTCRRRGVPRSMPHRRVTDDMVPRRGRGDDVGVLRMARGRRSISGLRARHQCGLPAHPRPLADRHHTPDPIRRGRLTCTRMYTQSVRSLRADLATAVRRAEAGEATLVTVHGRPVATLAPIAAANRSTNVTLHQLVASGAVIPARRRVRWRAGDPIAVWAGIRIDQVLREIRG